MSKTLDKIQHSAIRLALARDAYSNNRIRIADTDLAGCSWLVATHKGVLTVGSGVVKTALHGWFFGIHRHNDDVYMFESCGQYDFTRAWGRVLSFQVKGDRLAKPRVLVTGLSHACHQLAVIDSLLCVVDTRNQRILRFTLEGEFVDQQTPFPVVPPDDTGGGYLHMNSIAKIGDRIGLMLHNGKVLPEKSSELVWLDERWDILARASVPGRHCHDIVADQHGVTWHCASASGEIFTSSGQRYLIAPGMFTRGLVVTPEHIIVGVCPQGDRKARSSSRGWLCILNAQRQPVARIELTAPPTDIAAL